MVESFWTRLTSPVTGLVAGTFAWKKEAYRENRDKPTIWTVLLPLLVVVIIIFLFLIAIGYSGLSEIAVKEHGKRR